MRPTVGSLLSGVLLVLSAAGAACVSPRREPSPRATPESVVNELLAADREFAASSARTDLASGLVAMFAEDVTMPLPGGAMAESASQAGDALRANPDNAGARIEWTAIRGGISADGEHGFTIGYWTMHKRDASVVPGKYVAYWVRESRGWRVVAYRRSRRPPGAVSLAVMAPAVPARLVPPSADAAAIARGRASLMEAEQSFSDDAKLIGIGAAFAKYGSADAVNMGGPNDTAFVVGAERIGRGIGGEPPTAGSPVAWKSDRVIVASSGDLGVSIGMIRDVTDPSAPPAPFFTIWRKASACAVAVRR